MKKFKINIVILLILLFWCPVVLAQQSIIVVPSPDVLKQGQIYPRIAYRFRPFDPGPYEILAPSLVYGISNTSEAYVIISGLDFANEVEPTIGPSYKKIFQITPTTRYTIGNRMDISLVESETPSNFTYTHLSQQIPVTKTRLTAGIYTRSGEHFFPDRTGVLLGFEQAIIPDRITLAVDWISRNETFGFMGAGIKFRTKGNIGATTAVLIPNGDQAKFGFTVFIGKIFR